MLHVALLGEAGCFSELLKMSSKFYGGGASMFDL